MENVYQFFYSQASEKHFIWCYICVTAWVDAVWDVEFTERKPMDDPIEDNLITTEDKDFRNLYQRLLAHANGQQSADTDKNVQVRLSGEKISEC